MVWGNALALNCHSREGGNPCLWKRWIPAFAGMTIKSIVVAKSLYFWWLMQYIAENHLGIKPNISGLYIIMKKQGNGISAKPGDKLLVNYTGEFLSGEKFDSSYDRNEPFEFKLGNSEVIPAWEEGFFGMKEGTKAKFIIPSHLAYGENGFGKIILPFTSLVFEVELLKVTN